MSDNRAAELAEWNAEQLKTDAANGLSLQPWFSAKEQAKLLRGDAGGGNSDSSPQMGGLEYRVVIDCASEAKQLELLARFEEEGLVCRALIS